MAQSKLTQYVIDQIKALVEKLEEDEAHVEKFIESMTPESKGIDSDHWEVFEVGRTREMRIKYAAQR